MRRVGTAVLLLALASAGCGGPRPSQLAARSRAIIVNPQGGHEPVSLRAITGGVVVGLEPGTRVTVVDDSAHPESDWTGREVVVQVEDGRSRGLAGSVIRAELRPE